MSEHWTSQSTTAVVLVVLACAGCKTTPEREKARLELGAPAQWTGQSLHLAEPLQPWLSDFDTPALGPLVREAMTGNYDLQAMVAKLDAALALSRISRADLRPTLEGSFGATRSQRVSSSGGQRLKARSTDLSLLLSAAWELDVWGRLRDQRLSARADLQAVTADLIAARLSLAAQMAKRWFDAITADQQVKLAEQTVKTFKASQRVIEDQFARGISSALDVRLGRADVATAENRLASRKIQRDRAIRILEVFLGRYPASSVEVVENLPSMKRDVPVGLPSELLQRRPDLLAAEHRLVSSKRLVAGAKKARLPSFRLTGSGGTSSDALKRLLNSNYLIWNLAANLTQPIFNAGELKARVAQAEANRNEILARYSQAILQAFREVETALTSETLLRDQEAALRTAVEQSVEAETLALDEYTKGLVDIITLLNSQTRTFVARSELINVRNQQLQNRVDLYLALGGGFDSVEQRTPIQGEDAGPQN